MAHTLNVKTGDNVVVITGKDAGKQGRVLACYPDKNRIVVEGVNIISRHTKARSAQEAGGIIKREGTIDVSNVMLVCPTCGKPTRVKHSEVDGKHTRVCKCGAVLDKKFEKVSATKKKAQPKEKKEKVENANEKPAKKTSTKLEKSKTTKSTAVKNKAEGASVKRKQEM
ncbi:MAG: 50S ribosomal protein L24 [Clostridia bacterium]|nr:50S ribosomal protein L24 [Clostridia bacterium]